MENSVIQVLKGILSVIFGAVTAYVGGFDGMIRFYIGFACLDYLLGVMKGIKKKEFSSALMFWGFVNKLIALVLIGIAYQLDVLMGTQVFRNIFVIWFCLCECASMMENLAIIGVDMPEGLKDLMIQAKKGFSINIMQIVKKYIDEYVPQDSDSKAVKNDKYNMTEFEDDRGKNENDIGENSAKAISDASEQEIKKESEDMGV